jgi:hypothetical protein
VADHVALDLGEHPENVDGHPSMHGAQVDRLLEGRELDTEVDQLADIVDDLRKGPAEAVKEQTTTARKRRRRASAISSRRAGRRSRVPLIRSS